MFFMFVADVQTQAMYQMLDEGFVGLIYSVFNEKKQTRVRIVIPCLSGWLLYSFREPRKGSRFNSN